MAYKIIFAPTAIARLEDIVRYIAADDPATARTFAMHLLDRAEARESGSAINYSSPLFGLPTYPAGIKT